MSRKISWTNNSIGHSGTYVYRAPTLDPQNLPAPVATVSPVGQGVTAEWVDNDSLAAGDYDYAVQDFDGQGVGALSAVADYTAPVDYSTAQAGDEIGGGIYAGIITYSDSRQFHIIAGKQNSEISGLTWRDDTSATGITDEYDGMANTASLLAYVDANAAIHCDTYSGGGFGDWYLPARWELKFIADNLAESPEFSTLLSSDRWSSTEEASSTTRAYERNWVPNTEGSGNKTFTNRATRPIRRVPV